MEDINLTGTTYRVYRFMLRQRKAVGISQVQKALGLSSPSVSEYHMKKLLRLGLVKEKEGGYVVDKVLLDNVVRVRKMSIPTQTSYVALFVTTLVVLLTFLRPATLDALYVFATLVNVSAVIISCYEAWKTIRRL